MSLPNLTLFDMIRPESWITVQKRKSARRMGGRPAPAAAMTSVPPIGISEMRSLRLNCLLGYVGPARGESWPRGDGPGSDGYMAQAVPGPSPPRSETSPCTFEIDRSTAREPTFVAARVPRRGTPGFPSCGLGRARRIRPLSSMAGRGTAAPPAKKPAVAAGGLGGAAPPPGR